MSMEAIINDLAFTGAGLFSLLGILISAGLILFSIAVLFRLPKRLFSIAFGIVVWATGNIGAFYIMVPAGDWAIAPWWFYVAIAAVVCASLPICLSITQSHEAH